MLALTKAVTLRILRAGTLSVGLRLASSPGATRPYSHSPRQTTRYVRNMSSSVDEGPGTSGTTGAQKEEPREQKKIMRKRIKSELKAMSEAAVDAASASVAERLLVCPQLQQRSTGEGGGGGVSVYLSMPGELGTAAIVSGLFKRGKKVYIPKVCRRQKKRSAPANSRKYRIPPPRTLQRAPGTLLSRCWVYVAIVQDGPPRSAYTIGKLR